MSDRLPPGPSWDVEVNIQFGSPTYGNLAADLYGWENRAWWEALGDLLGGRPGWHCDFTSAGLLWSFGAMGSSLLNISAPAAAEDPAGAVGPTESERPAEYEAGIYTLFDYEADTTHTFEGPAPLLAWLEDNEGRNADHLRKLKHLASANDWRVLKGMGIEVHVTHDGASFIATFPAIPFESAFASELPTVLVQAREAIARAHDAPEAVAPDISVTARLDAAATAALHT